MATNLGAFRAQLQAAKTAMRADATRVFRAAAFIVWEAITVGMARYNAPGTPYKTGNARAGWQGDAAIATANLGDVLSFTNRVVYIERLEFGWSQQAPNGMVRIVEVQWDRIVSDVAGSGAAQGAGSAGAVA